MAWVLMGMHKGALCAAAAPAGASGAAGVTDLRLRVPIVPGEVHSGGGPYTPARAPPGCCPGTRASPSPGDLGLGDSEGHFIAAGSEGPHAHRPGPLPRPRLLGSARRLGARGKRGEGPWGAVTGRGGTGRKVQRARTRGQSRADRASSESPPQRRLRWCGRGSDSASCPAPIPTPRPRASASCRRDPLLMVGTNLAS